MQLLCKCLESINGVDASDGRLVLGDSLDEVIDDVHVEISQVLAWNQDILGAFVRGDITKPDGNARQDQFTCRHRLFHRLRNDPPASPEVAR